MKYSNSLNIRGFVGLQFDDMANEKSTLPRCVEKTKGLAGLKTLKTKITGAILNSSLYKDGRKTIVYINHDEFENGSNKVVTLIYKMLHTFIEDHGFLPRKLFLTSDNCARENKNQYVFAFLYGLVELGIVEEVVFSFLHVGHTGFAPDQMFSILAADFKKTNIRTLEDLIWLISKSSIKPAPIVEKLEYIYNWKDHIATQMAAPLKNHTFPKAFLFIKEDKMTKMKYKFLPQDVEWKPESGIKLLKDDPDFGPVGPAAFRFESLELDEFEASLRTKYFPTLQAQIRLTVTESWGRLRRRFEGMERKKNTLPKMKLEELPKSGQQPVDVFEFHEEEVVRNRREVSGELYPETNGDVKVGEDIAVYTTEKAGRPWVGRVKQVTEKEVVIHWFARKNKKFTYDELNNRDGSPQTDKIFRDSIIYRCVSSVSKETSFQITPTWLEKITKEYERMDSL